VLNRFAIEGRAIGPNFGFATLARQLRSAANGLLVHAEKLCTVRRSQTRARIPPGASDVAYVTNLVVAVDDLSEDGCIAVKQRLDETSWLAAGLVDQCKQSGE
jgi:hypothetical protein